MAMGRRKTERQEALFITADALPKSAGHPFYRQLNVLLKEADFDRWVEDHCRPHYEHEELGGGVIERRAVEGEDGTAAGAIGIMSRDLVDQRTMDCVSFGESDFRAERLAH